MDRNARPLAHVVRGDLVESVHLGHLVLLDDTGHATGRRGDPDEVMFPRSALKPVQAVAMLRAGLDLHGELLALASASHSGEPEHLDGVRRILAGAGLEESALDNTPDLPLAERSAGGTSISAERSAGGHPPSSIAQNCSGKHAAMLATCVAAGWPTEGYRDPSHPLQRLIRSTVADLTGDGAEHLTVDGCGAPLFSATTTGLARAFARIATAAPGTPEGRVADAVRAHPWWVGGTGRPVTRFCETVPGLVAKDGAEGVFAGALPDGRAFALKVLDGSSRAVPAVVAAALGRLGAGSEAVAELGRTDVLGHGAPVGRITAEL
ncbi:asparaginase [Pseudonocardia sp. KRD291]|uniref:asparaginase n=1 Tax=Pseudonocardia sp. KRD291 TaxID=2792007 RepID=UPI001C49E6C8|nr:asparaginase [Pseudonocardia sp. KRD291]